jgi:hypothetical protein
MTDEGKRRDKKISLAPLDFEEALRGLLQTEPPPEKKAAKEKARPKGGRPRKKGQGRPNRDSD